MLRPEPCRGQRAAGWSSSFGVPRGAFETLEPRVLLSRQSLLARDARFAEPSPPIGDVGAALPAVETSLEEVAQRAVVAPLEAVVDDVMPAVDATPVRRATPEPTILALMKPEPRPQPVPATRIAPQTQLAPTPIGEPTAVSTDASIDTSAVSTTTLIDSRATDAAANETVVGRPAAPSPAASHDGTVPAASIDAAASGTIAASSNDARGIRLRPAAIAERDTVARPSSLDATVMAAKLTGAEHTDRQTADHEPAAASVAAVAAEDDPPAAAAAQTANAATVADEAPADEAAMALALAEACDESIEAAIEAATADRNETADGSSSAQAVPEAAGQSATGTEAAGDEAETIAQRKPDDLVGSSQDDRSVQLAAHEVRDESTLEMIAGRATTAEHRSASAPVVSGALLSVSLGGQVGRLSVAADVVNAGGPDIGAGGGPHGASRRWRPKRGRARVARGGRGDASSSITPPPDIHLLRLRHAAAAQANRASTDEALASTEKFVEGIGTRDVAVAMFLAGAVRESIAWMARRRTRRWGTKAAPRRPQPPEYTGTTIVR